MKTAILRRLRKEEKGFTLIELLAVIVILGVIAAIAIPLIGNIIDKSKKDSDVATARQIYDAARMYVTSEKNSDFAGNPSISVAVLITAKYLDTSIYLPSTKNVLNTTNSVITFNSTTGELTNVILEDSPTTGSVKKKTYSPSEILSVKSTQ